MQQLPRHVIGVGASAGGVEALRTLVADLPADLDAAVCIVAAHPVQREEPAGPDPRPRDPAGDRAGRARGAAAPRSDLRRPGRPASADPPRRRGAQPRPEGERRAPRRGPDVPLARRRLGARTASPSCSRARSTTARRAPRRCVEAGGRLLVQEPLDALVPGMPTSAIAVAPARRDPPDRRARRRARPAQSRPRAYPGSRPLRPQRRASRPGSRARSAPARCGSRARASSPATAAASATPTPRRRWSRPRAAPSRRRCGRR